MIRHTYLKNRMDEEDYPSWASGFERMPSYLQPPSAAMITLHKNNAKAITAQALIELTSQSQKEKRLADQQMDCTKVMYELVKDGDYNKAEESQAQVVQGYRKSEKKKIEAYEARDQKRRPKTDEERQEALSGYAEWIGRWHWKRIMPMLMMINPKSTQRGSPPSARTKLSALMMELAHRAEIEAHQIKANLPQLGVGAPSISSQTGVKEGATSRPTGAVVPNKDIITGEEEETLPKEAEVSTTSPNAGTMPGHEDVDVDVATPREANRELSSNAV
jgi:hypothetical protein